MGCEYEDRARWLVDYLDGGLEEDARRAVEAHLARCPACRSAVEEHRAVWRLLDAYTPPDPPEGFTASVLRARARAGRALRLRRAVLAAAAAVLVAGTAWWFFAPPGDGGADGGGRERAAAGAEEAVDPELLRNLDLLEELDFLERYGEDLELAMDADLYDLLASEENL